MVKNEEETLEKGLRLARPHVDEIVVVDTGSTDGTREIARRYADVFDQIQWPGSFAKARNETFDRATGEFIMVLDGDEYLPDPWHWKRIHKQIRQPEVAAVQLLIRNLLAEGQIIHADRMWQERIFRNDDQIRYEGRVHHQVQKNLAAYMTRTGRKLFRVEAEIVHTGYALSTERMAEKYVTRIDLLKEEIKNPRSDKHRAYYGYQLGVVYYVMQRYAEAGQIFSELDYSKLTPDNAYYTHLLAAQTALKLDQGSLALAHSNEMLTLNRNEPVGYYTTGLALFAARNLGDSLLMLLEAYNVNESADTPIRFVLNPDELLRVFSIICTRGGLLEHAQKFQAFREVDKLDNRAVKALIQSLKEGIVLSEMRGAA